MKIKHTSFYAKMCVAAAGGEGGADSRHFGATVNSRLWSTFKRLIWRPGALLGMLSLYHRECSVFSSFS